MYLALFSRACLERPVLVDRLDGPFKLLTQSLREELFDRYIELFAEDDGQPWINVVLFKELIVCTTDMSLKQQ